MYQLKITLKQHTPLIHFQHDQDGATLRASEVKPKLDRFLIEQNRNALEKFIKKTPSNHEFLDYKMRIVPNGNQKYTDLIEMKLENDRKFIEGKDGSFPTFFGNLMKVEEYNKGKPYKKVSFYDTVTLHFTIKNRELKEEIVNSIDDFFLSHNFGTRQSKGFGSFTTFIDNTPKSYSVINLPNINRNDFNDLFSKIELFYKSIRGGLRAYGKNGCIFYFKSLLVAYFHQMKTNELWDKQAIKEILENNKENASGIDIKDLLGFSTSETWRAIYETNIVKSNNDIDRFSSPIFFKPIYNENDKKWQVFIFLKTIPLEYLNSTVLANVKKKDVTLKMWSDFKLDDFMKFVLTYNSEEKITTHIIDFCKADIDPDQYFKHSNFPKIVSIFQNHQVVNS